MSKTPPTAFLCHSVEDKDSIANRIARDLRNAGINLWYDEWEIKPGDSLRRKIDEGISNAANFLALLTPNSIKSKGWVQTELDAAMVRRISGSARLIPILWNVGKSDVPPTLAGMLWVSLDPYEDGLKKLITTCFEVDIKPALGPVPAWVEDAPLLEDLVEINARRLAKLLSEKSATGMNLDPQLSSDEVMKALNITDEEAGEAAADLDALGLVTLHKSSGMGPCGFRLISPRPEFFIATDRVLKGWDTVEDSRTLAGTIINSGKSEMSMEEVSRLLSWKPRRINPPASYLHSHNYADCLEAGGSFPYEFVSIRITPRTKRFVAGRV